MSGPAEKRVLKPIHWAEHEGTERPPYLVKGVLTDGAFSVLFGDPGHMKSFVALDLSLHVALDRPWHGQRVRGGPALYVACEGGRSVWDRVAAFEQHHGIDRKDVPFYVLPETVNLGKKTGDLKPLVEALKSIGEVRLIVIDTLNRALFGGDENSPADMGTLVTCCDAIRRRSGGHVMLIHHLGKDKTRGPRGHSSLNAAIDTELKVTKADGVCLVETTKQRDLPEEFDIGFRWTVIEVGEDEDGDPITSLALEPTDDRPAPEERLSKAAGAALQLLWSATLDEGEHLTAEEAPSIAPHFKAIPEDRWRELFIEAGISRADSSNGINKAFRRSLETLVKAGRVRVENDWAWPLKVSREAPEGDQIEAPF